MQLFNSKSIHILAIGLLCSQLVKAQELEISIGKASEFMYYSETELTRRNERLIFNLDAGARQNRFVNGRVLTADRLLLDLNGPVFYDTVMVANGDLSPFEDNFETRYYENVPNTSLDEPSALIYAAGNQGNYISNLDGMLKTRLRATTGGLYLEQWSNGLPYDSSRIDNARSRPFGTNVVIYVEGDLQFAGSIGGERFGGSVGAMRGSMTIGCSGNLEIWDNIMYTGLTVGNLPDSLPNDFGPLLGLVSEGNIIVKDVFPNGRGNGGNGPGNHGRRHIVITAALLAYGSFTIEHHNNPNDTYVWCDPDGAHQDETDERGTIILRGSLAQGRRGYLHTDNCDGTGYAKNFIYDQRFLTNSPPYFPEIIAENTIFGEYRRETIEIFGAAQVWPGRKLELGHGTTLRFHRMGLEIGKLILDGADLYINGSEQLSVRIFANYTSQLPMRMFDDRTTGNNDGVKADSIWEFLQVTATSFEMPLPELVENSIFKITSRDGRGNFIQTIEDSIASEINNSWFEGTFEFGEENRPLNDIHLQRNVVEGRISFNDTDLSTSLITNCTFVAEDEDYDEMAVVGADTIRNTFFHGNYRAIEAEWIDYSGTYNSLSNRPFGNNGHDGLLIDVDPMFADARRHDYSLEQDSPLINAGHPDSPRDPDNTRVDIGASVYDGPFNSIGDQDNTAGMITEFSIDGPFPNPFNGIALVTIGLPTTSELTIRVTDILGREVVPAYTRAMKRGLIRHELNLEDQASGIYFIAVKTQEHFGSVKALYLK